MIHLKQTDNELLALIARRDGRALGILYTRYYDLLCLAAYKKLGNDLTVEELVQDVFVVFWQKAPNLDEYGDVKAYLFATLRNKILYELRTRMTRANMEILFEPAAEVLLIDASDLLAAKELEQRIAVVLKELSPQSREAFKLSRYEDMSYKKIAAHMNISVTTVEKHISKALSTLRKEFKEVDNSFLIAITVCILQSH